MEEYYMNETVFTKVDYNLGTLVEYITLGEIGLPDIQRPFVWKNTKVRDLFDSMYRGYPVGYLLFWQNGLTARTIGSDSKQKPPRLVIVDGQQRLTSLYAVIKGIPVLRKNYEYERIQIAFNPLEEKLEVADAAIRRNKTFIPDISILWSSETKITKIIRNYLDDIKSIRNITEDEESIIEDAILKLQGLVSFPFTTLELAMNISEENVSEIFVRVNSKGTPLNQADFILTLMSVFWDDGRAELERFCRNTRQPSKGQASPFNYFIEPFPDQLLRVGVGLAFKRARLKYVYSLLRGKDLETEQFSEERRVAQFDVLKKAQDRVLNLQYWHDFMACIRQAGFRSGAMISSQNNLLFAYLLYLMGRTEYNVPEFELRSTIARWFFMSSLTGRFTSSPESAMEFDLARFREISDAEDFVRILNQICDTVLTNDFWIVTLPNDLATSSPRSPSLFAFQAAQVILDAQVLFSKVRVAELLDPALNAHRSAVERHHLFPKGYLKKQGITEVRDTNQIANYALVEWGDNVNIADEAPSEYLPQIEQRFESDELARMYHWHALPDDFEKQDYKKFLERRRERMAQVIREGFKALSMGEVVELPTTIEFELEKIIENGESTQVEFKSTLRTNLHTGEKDPRMEMAVLKSIAGFLNTGGGTLIVGLADDGTPVGIELDGFLNEDKMNLHLVNIIKAHMGPQAMTNIFSHFEDHKSKRVFVINCKRSPSPVYFKDETLERFFIRTGPSTTELSASQTQNYISKRF
jgi:hypothetical protein